MAVDGAGIGADPKGDNVHQLELTAAVDDFLVYLRSRRRAAENTITGYGLDLADFVLWCNERGVLTVVTVDRNSIRSWLAWLHREGYAPSSISRKLAAVRSLFRFVDLHGQETANPLSSIRGPKQVKYLPGVLSLSEVERLLAQPDRNSSVGIRDFALLEVLYATGVRVGELLALNLGDIDWGDSTIRVRGKGNKERIVLLGEPAMIALETYIHEGRPELFNGHDDIVDLFLSRLGRRLSVRMFHVALGKYLRMAGLEKHVTPHTLRHTFASHLLEGGADLRIVQELLGHANLSTTQIYTHISEGHLRDVYSRAHPNA